MTAVLLATAAIAPFGALGAQDRRTILVDRMHGLEPYVEKALKEAELPFDIVEESSRPDLTATLTRIQSGYAEVRHKHKLGRSETHRLELRDLHRGATIASHSFELRGDDRSRTRAAEEFAAKVKKALAKANRTP